MTCDIVETRTTSKAFQQGANAEFDAISAEEYLHEVVNAPSASFKQGGNVALDALTLFCVNPGNFCTHPNGRDGLLTASSASELMRAEAEQRLD